MPLTSSHRSSTVSLLTSRRSTWGSTVPGFTFNPTNCNEREVTGVEALYLSSCSRSRNRLQTITSNSLKQNQERQEARTPVPFSHLQET